MLEKPCPHQDNVPSRQRDSVSAEASDAWSLNTNLLARTALSAAGRRAGDSRGKPPVPASISSRRRRNNRLPVQSPAQDVAIRIGYSKQRKSRLRHAYWTSIPARRGRHRPGHRRPRNPLRVDATASSVTSQAATPCPVRRPTSRIERLAGKSSVGHSRCDAVVLA